MDYKTRKKLQSLLTPHGLNHIFWHGARRIGTITGKSIAGPVQIRINPLSYTCNLKCPMCNLQQMNSAEFKKLLLQDQNESLSYEDYNKLLSRTLKGLVSINITGGGEPLLHRDILKIMHLVKKNRFRGSLITNGALLDEEKAKQIISMKWDGVRVSLHSGDPDTYQEICGVNNFNKIKENLLFFDRQRQKQPHGDRPALVLFNVLQRANMDRIKNIFITAEEVGADYIEFEKVIPFNNSMALSVEELNTAKRNLVNYSEKSKVPCNFLTILKQLESEKLITEGKKEFRPAERCSVGFDQMFITAQGDVFPCCFSNEKMGNIKNESLLTIWNGKGFSNFRNQLMKGKFRSYCYDNHCALSGVLHNW